MNARYLKIMMLGLTLAFLFQGCSFSASFLAKQKSSPQPTNNTEPVAKVQQEQETTN